MIKVIEYIINDSLFTPNEKKIAKYILKALKLNIDKNLDNEAFRIHSKGVGLICNKYNINKKYY